MITFIDAGPLTALIDKRDQWHNWAVNRVKEIKSPLITCEAVLSECCFILNRSGVDLQYLFNFIDRGDIRVESSFVSTVHQKRVIEIINTYHNLPASFADACLVCMAENTASDAKIFTLDNHFNIYRTDEGKLLSLISPAS
ncbi:MAG TPA: PIN domain-containing protein [Balneolaceae bacterium]|nr:PIN domain-containing protein [Balneolaceae bacterium]